MKTIEWYRKFAQDFAMETWGMEYDLVFEVNNRRKSSGVFITKRVDGNWTAWGIQINFKVVNTHEEMLDVIKHELCHWYCFVTGKNYHDGDKDFEQELNRIGGISTKFGYNNLKRSEFIQNATINNEMTTYGLRGTSFLKVRVKEVEDMLKERNHPYVDGTWIYSTIESPTHVFYKNKYVATIFKFGKGWCIANENSYNERRCWTTRKALVLELVYAMQKSS